MFTLSHSRSRIAAAMIALSLALFAGTAAAGSTTSPALASPGLPSQTHA